MRQDFILIFKSYFCLKHPSDAPQAVLWVWVPGQVLHQVGFSSSLCLSGPSILSSANKQLPLIIIESVFLLDSLSTFFCVPPIPKGNWHLFDLIPGGFCPPNKSMHGDVAFATLLCSAEGLDPTVEAKGFSRIKAKEKGEWQ